jgi:hypothetical protein
LDGSGACAVGGQQIGVVAGVCPAGPDFGPDRLDQLLELANLIQDADPGPQRGGRVVDDLQPLGHGAVHGAEAFAVLVGLGAQRLAPPPHLVLELSGALLRAGEMGPGRVAEPFGLPGQRDGGFIGVPDDQRGGLLGSRADIAGVVIGVPPRLVGGMACLLGDIGQRADQLLA